jgi:hypothetical protein
MTLSFGRVGLGCLTPLSFQQYFSYIVTSIGDLWKPAKILVEILMKVGLNTKNQKSCIIIEMAVLYLDICRCQL